MKTLIEYVAHREGQRYLGTSHEKAAYERGFLHGHAEAQPIWHSGEDSPPFGTKILAEDINGSYLVLKVIEGDCRDDGTCLVDYLDESGNYADDVELIRWTPLIPIIGTDNAR